MKQRNKGFTVIELLIVISIIMILMSMLMIGLKALIQQGRASNAKTELQSLQGLLQNLDASGELSYVQLIFGVSSTDTTTYSTTAITAAPVGPAGTYPTSDTTVTNTQLVIAQLLRLPDNMQAFAKLPPNQKLSLGSGQQPIVLDPWQNPIIFVPGGGLNVTLNGNTVLIQSPDKKGFWASPGPNGNFNPGYYSFVSQY